MLSVNKITSVLYIPELSANLLSVTKLIEKDYKVIFERIKAKIFALRPKGNLVAMCILQNSLFILDTTQKKEKAMVTSILKDEIFYEIA